MRLSEDEIKNIEHVKQILKNDIKTLDEKLKGLHKLSSKLNSYLWDRKFECPEKFSDPICLNCEYALPDPLNMYSDGRNYYRWQYPGNVVEKEFMIGPSYCLEWKKKISHSACGCAGDASCKCGYWGDFCYLDDGSKCPFCGRLLKINRTGNIFTADWNTKL